MLAEPFAWFVATAWQWLAIVGTAIVSASIAELLVRKAISPRLAGAVAIVSGALAATIVGSLLFDPILLSTPDATTFSFVGAVAGVLFWVLLRLLLRNFNDVTRADYFRLCRALLLCGIVAGALTGLLSCCPFGGVLYCTPLGLFVGLLLAGPYFLVALLERRRASKVLSPTAMEKATEQSSGKEKAPRE